MVIKEKAMKKAMKINKCCRSVVRPIIEQSRRSDTGSNPVGSTTAERNEVRQQQVSIPALLSSLHSQQREGKIRLRKSLYRTKTLKQQSPSGINLMK